VPAFEKLFETTSEEALVHSLSHSLSNLPGHSQSQSRRCPERQSLHRPPCTLAFATWTSTPKYL